MSSRSTAVLLVIALGLGAWVYFVEIRGSAEKTRVEEASRRLIDLEADDILAFELPLEEGGTARLARDANDWVLEQPIAYPADELTAGRIVDALSSLRSELRIDDPGDLAIYGLGPQSPTVRVFGAGEAMSVLRLGSDAPIGVSLYVSVEGEDDVFTVKQASVTSLRPTLLRLRDRRLLQTELDAVDSVEVRESGAVVVRLEREDATDAGRWQIRDPIDARGDAARVRRLLQDLAYSRVSGFVDEPGEPAEYGLDAPELEVLIGAGGASSRLILGRSGDKAYARLDGAGPVFEIRERLLGDVPRELFPYRFKRVLEIDEDRVRRVVLEFPRSGAQASFSREGLADPWVAADPNEPVDSLRVSDIVFGLASLDATGIDERSVELGAVGLEPPRVRVELEGADGEELGWIELGDLDLDSGLAARSSSGPGIWRVENRLGEDVPLGLDAFRTNWLSRDEPASDSGVAGDDPQ